MPASKACYRHNKFLQKSITIRMLSVRPQTNLAFLKSCESVNAYISSISPARKLPGPRAGSAASPAIPMSSTPRSAAAEQSPQDIKAAMSTFSMQPVPVISASRGVPFPTSQEEFPSVMKSKAPLATSTA